MRMTVRKYFAAWAKLSAILGALLGAGRLVIAADAPAVVDHGVDIPMETDPLVTAVGRVQTFDSRLKDLWLQTLDRPEADLKIRSLETFAMARERGMTGTEEVAPKIVRLLDDVHQPEAIHLAAARALASLDAKETAPLFLAQNKTGGWEMILITDPALARWNTEGANVLWLSRLTDTSSATQTEQVLRSAMRSLGTTAALEAVEPLKAIVVGRARNGATRMVAAEALSHFPAASVIATAETLSREADMQEHLLAATILPAVNDQRVAALLAHLAEDPEPAVVAIAVQKLLDGAPGALAPLTVKLADNHDAAVRRLAVNALHIHANPQNLGVLEKLLNDDAPKVRVAAREAMIDCDAKPELRPVVRQDATHALASSGDSGKEQAAFILGTLHENSARDRLVELLVSKDKRVRLACVIALRRLNLPDTYDIQFERAQTIAKDFEHPPARTKQSPPPQTDVYDFELSQLIQNLGMARYTAADGFFQKFIPKHAPFGGESRVAAIWSLGLLHESKTDAKLARAFVGRLTDLAPLDPELPSIRAISAISLGRMHDTASKAALLQFVTAEGGSQIGESCRWAVAQLEGKPYVAPPKQLEKTVGWFLEPVD
jgi:HEAT repeat protein